MDARMDGATTVDALGAEDAVAGDGAMRAEPTLPKKPQPNKPKNPKLPNKQRESTAQRESTEEQSQPPELNAPVESTQPEQPKRRRRVRTQTPGRQRAEWGGTMVGAALLGWLAAAGAAILMTDFVVAAGTAVGLGAAGTSVAGGVGGAQPGSSPMGFAGAVSLFVIHFVAFTGGGYVAGRISRFSGATQGFLVWVVSVVVALAIAGLAATAGQQFNVLAGLNVFPRIPWGEGDLTPATAITTVLVVIVSLVGSVLGGVLGSEFYRKAARRGAEY